MEDIRNLKTTEDRDLFLSEIAMFRRKDTQNLRQTSLSLIEKTKDLKVLDKQIRELETVNITLAVEPTISIFDLIYDYLKEKLKKQFLVGINIDKNIIGGAVFVYRGKYLDYSIKEKLKNEGL